MNDHEYVWFVKLIFNSILVPSVFLSFSLFDRGGTQGEEGSPDCDEHLIESEEMSKIWLKSALFIAQNSQ